MEKVLPHNLNPLNLHGHGHSSRSETKSSSGGSSSEFTLPILPSISLHVACLTGNLGLVQFLLAQGQSIDSVLTTAALASGPHHLFGSGGGTATNNILEGADGLLPLHAACIGGSEPVVHFLIERGADVNAARLPRTISNDSGSGRKLHHHHHHHREKLDKEPGMAGLGGMWFGTSGSTPLHYAAAHGHATIVGLLLNYGAHPARADRFGTTPTMLAKSFVDSLPRSSISSNSTDSTLQQDAKDDLRRPSRIRSRDEEEHKLDEARQRGEECLQMLEEWAGSRDGDLPPPASPSPSNYPDSLDLELIDSESYPVFAPGGGSGSKRLQVKRSIDNALLLFRSHHHHHRGEGSSGSSPLTRGTSLAPPRHSSARERERTREKHSRSFSFTDHDAEGEKLRRPSLPQLPKMSGSPPAHRPHASSTSSAKLTKTGRRPRSAGNGAEGSSSTAPSPSPSPQVSQSAVQQQQQVQSSGSVGKSEKKKLTTKVSLLGLRSGLFGRKWADDKERDKERSGGSVESAPSFDDRDREPMSPTSPVSTEESYGHGYAHRYTASPPPTRTELPPPDEPIRKSEETDVPPTVTIPSQRLRRFSPSPSRSSGQERGVSRRLAPSPLRLDSSSSGMSGHSLRASRSHSQLRSGDPSPTAEIGDDANEVPLPPSAPAHITLFHLSPPTRPRGKSDSSEGSYGAVQDNDVQTNILGLGSIGGRGRGASVSTDASGVSNASADLSSGGSRGTTLSGLGAYYPDGDGDDIGDDELGLTDEEDETDEELYASVATTTTVRPTRSSSSSLSPSLPKSSLGRSSFSSPQQRGRELPDEQARLPTHSRSRRHPPRRLDLRSKSKWGSGDHLKLDLRNVSSHAEAEALLNRARGALLQAAEVEPTTSGRPRTRTRADTHGSTNSSKSTTSASSNASALNTSVFKGMDEQVDGAEIEIGNIEEDLLLDLGSETPLSARLAAYGEVLTLERRWAKGERQREKWGRAGSSDEEDSGSKDQERERASGRSARRGGSAGTLFNGSPNGTKKRDGAAKHGASWSMDTAVPGSSSPGSKHFFGMNASPRSGSPVRMGFGHAPTSSLGNTSSATSPQELTLSPTSSPRSRQNTDMPVRPRRTREKVRRPHTADGSPGEGWAAGSFGAIPATASEGAASGGHSVDRPAEEGDTPSPHGRVAPVADIRVTSEEGLSVPATLESPISPAHSYPMSSGEAHEAEDLVMPESPPPAMGGPQESRTRGSFSLALPNSAPPFPRSRTPDPAKSSYVLGDETEGADNTPLDGLMDDEALFLDHDDTNTEVVGQPRTGSANRGRAGAFTGVPLTRTSTVPYESPSLSHSTTNTPSPLSSSHLQVGSSSLSMSPRSARARTLMKSTSATKLTRMGFPVPVVDANLARSPSPAFSTGGTPTEGSKSHRFGGIRGLVSGWKARA